MVVKVGSAAGFLAGVALVVSGCGAASFPTSTGTYSVKQVKEAFAAHGITLRPEPRPLASGAIALRGSRASRVGVVVARRPLGQNYFSKSLGQVKQFGNLFVFFPSSEKAEVATALQALP